MRDIPFIRNPAAPTDMEDTPAITVVEKPERGGSKRPSKKRKLAPPALILVAVVVVTVASLRRPPLVATAQPKSQVVVEAIAASGQVHGETESEVGAESSGRISALQVREGSRVTKNQLLARLDTRVLSAQERQGVQGLAVAVAQLGQISRSPLASEIENVRAQSREAIDVASAHLAGARQRLAELRRGATPEAITQARGQVRQATARLVQAMEDLSRERKLFGAGQVPRAALERAQTTRRVADEARRQADSQLRQAGQDLAREQEVFRTGSRSNLDKAQSAWEVARQMLGKAKADSVLAGQDVERQNLLFEGGAAPRSTLERAQATFNASTSATALAQAELDQAALDLARERRFFEEKSVPRAALERAGTAFQVATRASKQMVLQLAQTERDVESQRQLFQNSSRENLDHAQAAYDTARGAMMTAEATLRDTQLGPRREVLAQAEADVNAARQTLLGASISGPAQVKTLLAQPRKEDVALAKSQVQQAKRALDVMREHLRDALVFAPFPGTVTHIVTEAGGVTGPGQPILKLVRSGHPEIRVDVDETNLGRLRLGERAVVSSNAFPNVSFEARVRQIAAQVNADTGTVEVRLTPITPPRWLRPGQTLNVNLIVDEGSRHLTVPLTSVQNLGGEWWVWVVSDGVAHRKLVRTGPPGPDGVPILSGLAPKDEVVVVPTGLVSGHRVRVQSKG